MGPVIWEGVERRRDLKRIGIIAAAVLVMLAGSAASQEIGSEELELSPDIKVKQLTLNSWLYTCTAKLPEYDKPVSGNGLILVNGTSAVLIDLLWNDEQVKTVADWIAERFKAKIDYAVPTHYHQDSAGGLAAAHQLGAESWALHKTTVKLYDLGGTIPKNSFSGEKTIYCGDLKVELFYPGAGHTDDNIVVWIPNEKVLFAGCLVRPLDATDLGNVSEADLKAYPETLKKIQDRYKDVEIVVPGHGAPEGRILITHTADLVKKQKK